MIIEIELGIIVLSLLVLVLFLVPVLVQLRKTVEESERLLKTLNYDLPLLIKEATGSAQTFNRVSSDVREATERAKVLGQAIGSIGDTVNQIHGAIRNGAVSLWTNATGMIAGARAAAQVLIKGRPRIHPDGSDASDEWQGKDRSIPSKGGFRHGA
ncbi:MAG TPA: DUF948 domain-containing protein [Nitrospirales bacterium]|jgi:uncharacterized protein YoxC